jgi:hypothetical protein
MKINLTLRFLKNMLALEVAFVFPLILPAVFLFLMQRIENAQKMDDSSCLSAFLH